MKTEINKAIKWRWTRSKQFIKVRLLTFFRNNIEIGGVKLPFGPHLSDNIKEALLGKYYEAAELRMIGEKIKNDDIVMEIGAGIGLISTFCAKRVGSKNAHAFEANPSLEKQINNTYKINAVSPALTICLLADKEGYHPFYIEKDFWSSSMVRRSPEAKEVQIPMRLLNKEIKRINPSFLIMDIEGGEYSLFQYIDLHNIKKFAVELHTSVLGQEKIDFIKKKLEKAGFKIDYSVSNIISNYKEELYFERD